MNISLINPLVLDRFPTSEKIDYLSIIQWVPSMPNWNPWIGSNIDQGPLATATMDKINEDLFQAEQFRLLNRPINIQGDREKLPVFSSRQEIIDQINNNNVVLIRGATGCGKTTQV